MKKLFCVVFIFFSIGFSVFSQQQTNNSIDEKKDNQPQLLTQSYESIYVFMYVTSRSGLIQRSAPTMNSVRYGNYPFRTHLLLEVRGPRDTINGITNYWYRTNHGYWVFGGYLSEQYPR